MPEFNHIFRHILGSEIAAVIYILIYGWLWKKRWTTLRHLFKICRGFARYVWSSLNTASTILARSCAHLWKLERLENDHKHEQCNQTLLWITSVWTNYLHRVDKCRHNDVSSATGVNHFSFLFSVVMVVGVGEGASRRRDGHRMRVPPHRCSVLLRQREGGRWRNQSQDRRRDHQERRYLRHHKG